MKEALGQIAGDDEPPDARYGKHCSASALFNPGAPYDANNRRISIIAMNREA